MRLLVTALKELFWLWGILFMIATVGEGFPFTSIHIRDELWQEAIGGLGLFLAILVFTWDSQSEKQKEIAPMAKSEQTTRPPMTLGKARLCLAALAGLLLVVTGCTNADLERLRGRTPDQVKQACDPHQQTREECARTLDK
jgi:hypothetical protein